MTKPKPDRRIATAQAAREALVAQIDKNRDLVRSTRMIPSQREATNQLTRDHLAELRALDKRIYWLTENGGEEPEVPTEVVLELSDPVTVAAIKLTEVVEQDEAEPEVPVES